MRRIRQADLEEKAIELRLGQGIGSFHFDRIESRQHEKWRWEAIGGASHRDLQFGHSFQQRRLGLGRRAVDLIRQQDMGKDRSFDETELTAAVLAVHNHARASDIRGH